MPDRPTTFETFNGQRDVVANLQIAVRSALRQSKALAHVLLTGPAGLGKTTLAASVLPQELGVEARSVNCSAVEKPQDLTSVLSTMKPKAILFLDEIHALIPAAREHLLTVMEDHKLYVRIGETADSDILEVTLPEFTVIGATTREGFLDAPLRSRFGLSFTLQPYDNASMAAILRWHASKRGFALDALSVKELLGPAHGVARRAVNLIDACIDTAYGALDAPVDVLKVITADNVSTTLHRLGFRGSFEGKELKYLEALRVSPTAVGVKALAALLDEVQSTVEDVYEPWLLRQGYIQRTPAGRLITPTGLKALEEANKEA